jgi:DNA-binding phage protein
MSKAKTKPFDPAEYLDDSDSIAAYMTEALESGDPALSPTLSES